MLKHFTNSFYRSLLFVIAITISSCNPVITEADAIKINQEGVDHMNEGKYELAIQSFNEAIKNPKLTQPTKGTIYRNMAITFNSLDNIDSSLHYSTLAAKCFNKDSYNYLVNMADVDLITGRTGKALAALLRAAAINPDEMAVNNTLGLVYMGDYDENFTDLETALTYNKKAFEFKRDRVTEEVLGRNYFRLEDYNNAELHFKHLIGEYPDVINYLLYAGMTKYKLQKIPEADLLFNKILIQDSSYRETIEDFKINNR